MTSTDQAASGTLDSGPKLVLVMAMAPATNSPMAATAATRRRMMPSSRCDITVDSMTAKIIATEMPPT